MEETTTYPIRVYRFEKNGWGPYSSGDVSVDLYFKLLPRQEHRPGPERDNIPLAWRYGFYGCHTLELLLYWFDDCVELLFREGFHIAVYETQTYYLTPSQVVFFDKKEMNSIWSIEELMKLMGE